MHCARQLLQDVRCSMYGSSDFDTIHRSIQRYGTSRRNRLSERSVNGGNTPAAPAHWKTRETDFESHHRSSDNSGQTIWDHPGIGPPSASVALAGLCHGRLSRSIIGQECCWSWAFTTIRGEESSLPPATLEGCVHCNKSIRRSRQNPPPPQLEEIFKENSKTTGESPPRSRTEQQLPPVSSILPYFSGGCEIELTFFVVLQKGEIHAIGFLAE